jgi:hypothetical protein
MSWGSARTPHTKYWTLHCVLRHIQIFLQPQLVRHKENIQRSTVFYDILKFFFSLSSNATQKTFDIQLCITTYSSLSAASARTPHRKHSKLKCVLRHTQPFLQPQLVLHIQNIGISSVYYDIHNSFFSLSFTPHRKHSTLNCVLRHTQLFLQPQLVRHIENIRHSTVYYDILKLYFSLCSYTT